MDEDVIEWSSKYLASLAWPKMMWRIRGLAQLIKGPANGVSM